MANCETLQLVRFWIRAVPAEVPMEKKGGLHRQSARSDKQRLAPSLSGGPSVWLWVLVPLVVSAGIGCARQFQVVVPPASPERVVAARPVRVTLAIDPAIGAGATEAKVSYMSLPYGDLRVFIPYGSSLQETIRNAAAKTFASVRHGTTCAEDSAVLVKVQWAAEPNLVLLWESQVQEGALGVVEFPLRVTVSECLGDRAWARNLVTGYSGLGAPPAIFNLPRADDFQPIIAAALRDTAEKLAAVFMAIPVLLDETTGHRQEG